jgi:hypothetical protein
MIDNCAGEPHCGSPLAPLNDLFGIETVLEAEATDFSGRLVMIFPALR